MPKVLVVDDNEIDREAARRCLQPLQDFSMLVAEDGQAAVELLKVETPEVVITDLRMPRMDGLALVETLREEYPHLPVVLMTSLGSERIAVEALQAGASSYVPKRDLKTHLLETVQQLIEVSRAARQRERVIAHISAIDTRVLLPSDITLIPPLVGFLQDNLRRIGFGSESLRVRVGIALMEALSNAIIHGNLELDSDLKRSDQRSFQRLIYKRQHETPYAKRQVSLRATESRSKIEYVIRDEGPGFDVSRLPEKQASDLLDIAGRGVILMRSFMDEVRFSPKGNRLTLSKEAPSRQSGNSGESRSPY